MKKISYVWLPLLILTVALTVVQAQSDSQKLDKQVDKGMKKLLASSVAAKELSKSAKAILLFPKVKKAGFLIGGQTGEGALRVNGKTQGYFRSSAASFGLQAGAQKFGYAMFFMKDTALEYLKKSEGWEVGVGPTLVVVDEGAAGSLTTATAKSDIYVFFYGQKGLMAGLSIEGSKISKIDPDK